MGGLFGGGKNTTIDNGSVANFQINQATYGITVPIILGTSRQAANVLDFYDFTKIDHKSTQRTGKGGGSKTTTITHTYKAAVLLALCEGQIDGIGQVWIDTDTITTLVDTGLTLFDGSIGQPVWSYTTSKNPDHAIPYSGLAYVAGYIDLNDSGGLKQYNFEMQGQLRSTGDGEDVNPASAITYILTDSVNGLGFTLDNMHTSSLNDYKLYCQASNLYITVPLTDQSKAYEIINTICEITNTIVFWSQRKIKFVPRCEEVVTGNGVTYTPNLVTAYDLDTDDFITNEDGKLVTWERTDNAETYNQVTVEFTNRENGYETETVDYQILADINKRGLHPMPTVSYPYIHTKERAEQVAQQIAMDSCYGRNTYKFKLGMAHSLLEPGDIVTLTEEKAAGLTKLPVMIETATEDGDEYYDFEAKYKPYGTYTPAQYGTYPSERAAIDRYVDPGNINDPVIFHAPSELTTSGLETWIAVSGGENWGGCDVWVSYEGDAYQNIGRIAGPARHGILKAQIEAGEAIDTVNDLFVELISPGELGSGSQYDVDNLATLCYVDGELMAYKAATLQGVKQYNLHYLVRGVYGTEIVSHGIGSKFVRLDESLFKFPFTKDQIGKTIHIKFTSFNVFGVMDQSLADVEAFTHVLSDVYVQQVTDLKLVQHLREVRDGTNLYELEASWQPPSTSLYDHSDVYLKTSQPNWDEIETSWEDLEDTTLEDMTNANVWKYIGKAYNSILIAGCATSQTFTVKIVAATEQNFKADFEAAPTVTHEIKIKSYTPATPQNLSVKFTDVCTWSWEDVENTDNDFYELRLDKSYGDTYNRLARTNANTIAVMPPSRKGTVYLYAHNSSNQYSPATFLEYNKPAPIAPQNVAIADIFQGIVITCDSLPNYCLGINVYINDGTGNTVYFSPNNSYNFKATEGIFDIQVAYVDLFGEGEKSAEITKVIKPTIDPALIAAESLSLEMMDSVVKGAIEKAESAVNEDLLNASISDITQTTNAITQTVQTNKATQDGINSTMLSQIDQQAGQITQVVTNLNNANTVIAQNTAAIQLRATKDNLIGLINVSPETITIASKFNHIAGDTLIDDNVIVGKMLKASTITADKMNVGSLSSISATIGTLRTATTGARTEIKDNLILVYDANNVLRVRMGVW
ncbi:phage tail protein [Pelosinus propionicus]|uniref:Putative phage tail protein n=1 Tax=Pelosinus propionicus DSM 13327 TaxID=1123291 RepID=A0A1I4N0G7_9FIRM|nr:phage tail protein [Pelosinus propionicus]SFM09019.1 Putative phage tail protein [Pelosinus propionicus DSM 13327]